MGHVLNVIVFSIFLFLVNIIRNLFCVSKKKKNKRKNHSLKTYIFYFLYISKPN